MTITVLSGLLTSIDETSSRVILGSEAAGASSVVVGSCERSVKSAAPPSSASATSAMSNRFPFIGSPPSLQRDVCALLVAHLPANQAERDQQNRHQPDVEHAIERFFAVPDLDGVFALFECG